VWPPKRVPSHGQRVQRCASSHPAACGQMCTRCVATASGERWPRSPRCVVTASGAVAEAAPFGVPWPMCGRCVDRWRDVRGITCRAPSTIHRSRPIDGGQDGPGVVRGMDTPECAEIEFEFCVGYGCVPRSSGRRALSRPGFCHTEAGSARLRTCACMRVWLGTSRPVG